MRCGYAQRSVSLPGKQGHQGGSVTVHCKAHSLRPFGRLAGSLMELSRWDAGPYPEQFNVCRFACLLGPLQPRNVLPGVCRSRVQYLCQDELPQLGIFPAGSAPLRQSQICLWTLPGGILSGWRSAGRQDRAREISVQRTGGPGRAKPPSLPAWHLCGGQGRWELSGHRPEPLPT